MPTSKQANKKQNKLASQWTIMLLSSLFHAASAESTDAEISARVAALLRELDDANKTLEDKDEEVTKEANNSVVFWCFSL